jgi:hypothetical protein
MKYFAGIFYVFKRLAQSSCLIGYGDKKGFFDFKFKKRSFEKKFFSKSYRILLRLLTQTGLC